MVFVTGEPGIGKTALVDALLTDVDDGSAWSVARAECLEHHGAGEAYQPLLEALTRLCTQPHGEPCLAALRHCAPTWLAQLPSLQTPAEHRARQRRAAGATSERMLRELTDAFEMMTRRSSLVLCLEDLHWSDVATLDWIASFARRPEPARVLVIGTYRPGEAHEPVALTGVPGRRSRPEGTLLRDRARPARRNRRPGVRHGALSAGRWRRCRRSRRWRRWCVSAPKAIRSSSSTR